MKNILKKGVIAVVTLAVMVFSMPVNVFAADITEPTISISGASSTSIKPGGTVSYTVGSTDDSGTLLWFDIGSTDITMKGFTANVKIEKLSQKSKKVTFSNVTSTTSSTSKYFIVEAGVSEDADGNKSNSKSSPAFRIEIPEIPADTTEPTISIGGPSPSSIYAGNTVVYTVGVADDVKIKSYTLSSEDIKTNGFTANVTISGSGLSTRTVTLSNIQGTVGGSKYITVAAGVAKDVAGNSTISKNSTAFTIKETVVTDNVAPTISISSANPSSIYAGNTIVYTVSVADNVAITSYTLSKEDITTNGFSATITVTGSGNTRTVTLYNVQGTVGSTKSITVAAGVARDGAGNTTPSKVSPYFTIKTPVVTDTTAPTISISAATPNSIYAGNTVVYTVGVADDVAITSYTLSASDITLHGFTANVTISGSGLSTRTVTLTNIRGTVGGSKYITVAAGVARDGAGNTTVSKNSPAFTIIKDKDNTPPTIIIDGPNDTKIYAGESVRYIVAFMDNEGIASINLSSSNIILHGFTATISVTGSGNTRTVILTNIRGTIGSGKYITVEAGAATDTSGNKTPLANSDTFAIIKDQDTTLPTISIIGPVPYSIYNGETVSYRVYFADNEGIASIYLTSSNIILHGFTANVNVTGSGNSRIITLTNIQGTIGSGKYITIEAGAATDTSGNKTAAKSSNPFKIMQRPVVNSKSPVVTISAPKPGSIYFGEKVVYTVHFKDDIAVTEINLYLSKIKLHGFTATVKVTGTGLSTRTITLTNIKGKFGVNKYITITSGAALDVDGNRSAKAYSPRFKIKEKACVYVKPTTHIIKSNGTCIDDLKLLGDINKEITYFASWLKAEKYTASYVQESNYVAKNERMTYMVDYYNGSTAPEPDVNFTLTIPYKVIVEEINGNGKVTKATETETVIEWNLKDVPAFSYCRYFVRVKFLENKPLQESENISEIFYSKLKTTAGGNTSYSYMRQLFIDVTEGKTGTYKKYLTSIDSTNSIRPDDEVTRAEFAKMLADSGIVEIKVGSDAYKTFKDADKIPEYARDAVSALVGTDIIQAFTDGEFKPNNPILVEDAMQMIAQASRYLSETKLSIYKPVFIYTEALTGKDNLLSPKKDYIMEIMRQNVVVKYESNPDTYALRKDVVSMVNNLTFRGPYVESMPANTLKFADIREDSVYFYNIIGASNSYTYTYDYRLWQEMITIN